MQAAGRTGQQHLDIRKIRCQLHIVVGDMRSHLEDQFREPVLDQQAVREPLEEMIVEMLVRIDESGNHDHAGRVDRMIEGLLKLSLVRLHLLDVRAVDRQATPSRTRRVDGSS